MKEKVILVGVNYQGKKDINNSLEELKNLALGLDYDVVAIFTQKVVKINPSYYVGKGKINEIKDFIEKNAIKMVIFNDELSLSQIRNIEKELNIQVSDRSNLILDIFTSRASSKESKLQIEIAKLQYQLPRLVDSSQSLSRQRGGSVINRGSGETKLEVDRRKLENRIKNLKKELELVVAYRKTQRNLREKQEEKIVSLIGYTNTGKSTILNQIMEWTKSSNKQVLEKDMLFATLDTSVRQIKIDNIRSFLMTDTVGFIERLPHHLIEAFKSTLEEAKYADLLIHVVDYSHSNYENQIAVVNETLKDIGITNNKVITVYNKIDLINDQEVKDKDSAIYISAKNPEDINRLINKICEKLFNGEDYVSCQMLIPYDSPDLVNYFHEHAVISLQKYSNLGTILNLQCLKKDYEKYHKYVQ